MKGEHDNLKEMLYNSYKETDDDITQRIETTRAYKNVIIIKSNWSTGTFNNYYIYIMIAFLIIFISYEYYMHRNNKYKETMKNIEKDLKYYYK